MLPRNGSTLPFPAGQGQDLQSPETILAVQGLAMQSPESVVIDLGHWTSYRWIFHYLPRPRFELGTPAFSGPCSTD